MDRKPCEAVNFRGGDPGPEANMLSDAASKIGWKASDFALPAVDGKTYSLADVRGPKGTLVVFICNHCPYVKASIGRIVSEAEALRGLGVGRSPSCRTTPRPIARIPSST
jgi:hypothetical protein